MDTNTLITVMTVFVIISAIALCIQAGLLFGMYKASRALQEQVTSVMPQAKGLLSKAESTLDESRRHVTDISAKASDLATKANQMAAKANDMMDLGKLQMVKLDSVLTDATAKAKVQLERAELVVDDTVSRVHQSVTTVHNGIVKPIREVQGITAGIKAAVEHFVRGNRPSVAQATQQDEMFI